MGDVKLDKERFIAHLRNIYAEWKSSDDLKGVDAMAAIAGATNDEDDAYRKSTTLQIYLFGYELADTVSVFCKDAVLFLSSKKKIKFLSAIENCKENFEDFPTKIELLHRDKENDAANFDKIVQFIKESGDGKSLGMFMKEEPQGQFAQAFKDHLKQAGLMDSCVDIGSGLAPVLMTRDTEELQHVRKACNITTKVFQHYLREKIIDAVDADAKVKQDKLAENTEREMSSKKYWPPGVNPEYVEPCYTPIIQSGGQYSLKFSAESNREHLHFGAVVCMLGVRYLNYCSNIVRTYLVDPPAALKEIYLLLIEAEELLIKAIQPGVALNAIYEEVLEFVRSKRPDLVDKLTRNFGFAMGIEFREGSMLIGAKSTVKVRKGMVFNVCIGLQGIPNPNAKDGKGKEVAFMLGDTVVVGLEDGKSESLTEAAKKRDKSVCLYFRSEEEQGTAGPSTVLETALSANRTRGKQSTVVMDEKIRKGATGEEKRKQHQEELARTLNKDAADRIRAAKQKGTATTYRKSNVSYRLQSELPTSSEVRQLRVFVDKRAETVILPIYGIPVPFHISTIKNISNSVEGDHTYLRINFFHPGSGVDKKETFQNPNSTFLKELTYRSSNLKEPGEISAPSANLITAFRLIKEVQKKFRTREAEEREAEGIVKQDKLVLSQGKIVPRLKDLFVRPSVANKRMNGTLEAHVNGFRYTSLRGDRVDIMYNNIKHAFFQPSDHEMVIILHFNLKHAMLIGKKKHTEIQFYTEVGEITTDLGKHTHMHDRDDLQAEQAERELRQKLNQMFKSFCEKAEKLTNNKVEFDTPFRELGFHGVPSRSSVLLQPTSGCLVQLSEWPVFIVTLDEVELVHFERVMMSLKNFDMVFVFKDYTHKPAVVNSVPMNMLDHVKEWLNSCDIRYTEGVQSLNWQKIMKTIVDDPDGFFEGGGWDFLKTESDNEGEGDDSDSDEDDEVYNPTDEEGGGGEASGGEVSAASAEDTDSEDYTSEASDDESGSEASLSSGEESGKDWSELEEEAARDDDEREVLPSPTKHRKRHGDDRKRKAPPSSGGSKSKMHRKR